MAQWVIGNLEHHAKKGGSIVLQVCTIKKNVDRNTIQIELNWIGTFQLKKKKSVYNSIELEKFLFYNMRARPTSIVFMHIAFLNGILCKMVFKL